MTGIAILHILFGATLVAIGVLAAALADRVRGVRSLRPRERANTESRELAPRTSRAPRAATSIEVVEPSPSRAPTDRLGMSKDVIGALVAAGYKRATAAAAVEACTTAERATIENWTRAALRRCAQGGAS